MSVVRSTERRLDRVIRLADHGEPKQTDAQSLREME
jgi:hypothetical protein